MCCIICAIKSERGIKVGAGWPRGRPFRGFGCDSSSLGEKTPQLRRGAAGLWETPRCSPRPQLSELWITSDGECSETRGWKKPVIQHDVKRAG